MDTWMRRLHDARQAQDCGAMSEYQPPRGLEEMEAGIKASEKDILGMPAEVTR